VQQMLIGCLTWSTMGGAEASAAFQMRQVPSKELDSSAWGTLGQNSTKDTTFVWPASSPFGSPSSPACPGNKMLLHLWWEASWSGVLQRI